jgi:hypothetical protein
MTTNDFKVGDRLLIEFTDYDKNDGSNKPKPVIKMIEVEVSLRGSKKVIKNGEHGSSQLKNFKKDNCVKGSFGMVRWKNSWLNYSYKVIGGIDAIRDNKLNKLGL